MNIPRRPLRITLLSLFFALSVAVSGCTNYDELVTKDQAAAQKWSDIEATLQRRYDLIPNLVETVRASANVERDTLERIVRARAEATQLKVDVTDPASMSKFNEVQSELKGSLSRLLVT